MKKGTMFVKEPGREETFLVCSMFACGVAYTVLDDKIGQNPAAFLMLGTLIVLMVLRYTVLRNWFVRTIEWELDDEVLVFDGERIPRQRIYDVAFKRSRFSNGAWNLTIEYGQRIRVESVNTLSESRKSLTSMSELADLLRPRLQTPRNSRKLKR